MARIWTERDMPWLQEPLRQLVQFNQAHALILHGLGGEGLLGLGLRAAQAWLCERPDALGLPCDECPSCQLVQARSHPDLLTLMPEAWQAQLAWTHGDGEAAEPADTEAKGKRKPSRDVRVEAVRQAISWSHGTSSRGRGKALVMFPADAMNAVAANALLKTLEEPATGIRIFLCVEDAQRLLPTIRSRCQRLAVAGPDPVQARSWLAGQGLSEPDLLLQAAGGDPLRALELQALGWDAQSWRSLPMKVAAGQGAGLQELPLPVSLRILQQIVHDAMCTLSGASPRYFPEDCLPQARSWSALLQWQTAVARAVRFDEHPWNGGLLLESLLGQAHATFARKSAPA